MFKGLRLVANILITLTFVAGFLIGYGIAWLFDKEARIIRIDPMEYFGKLDELGRQEE